MRPYTQNPKKSWWLILLGIPFVFLLFPSFYNYEQPALIGIPFFYWFQFLWVFIVSLIMAGLYWVKD
jgi:hypothetical protein